MTGLHAELGWLPKAPDDFRGLVKALRKSDGVGLGAAVRGLAQTALGPNQLVSLANLLKEARRDNKSLEPLSRFRLGLIGNATTDFIAPAIMATGARFGLEIECVEADYGQWVQAALDPASEINRSRCDAVLIALDHHGLPLDAVPGDAAGAQAIVDAALDQLDNIRAGLRQLHPTTVICQTLARPADPLMGSYDAILPGTLRTQIDAFNLGLARRLAGTTDRLLDVSGIAETVGLAVWHDPGLWNLAKQPFANALIPLYADHLCRLIAAMRGKSRKVLVLDLDNTVWGGIIGDDGMDGIKIAQGDATGEAHLELQRLALALRDRGVLIAVSSKNDDEVARRVFREHPEMLLREEHIAVFQANWNDKATNITAIAEALSLGLDSFVFVDDNPAERGLVRRFLPQVAVPELPEDPALYARTVAAAGYFEAVGFSDEDRKRAAFYSDNARRVALQSAVGSIDDYLRSLDMTIVFAPFDDAGRARITQLINKSNQYNLTTRRYTEEEVADVAAAPDAFTLQVRLTDTFGDNGMISVLICRAQGTDWVIDTWLMSCRVLGRRVEEAVLDEVIEQARSHDIKRLLGIFRPSDRNSMVRDHYQKLGFIEDGPGADGETLWSLPLDQPRESSRFTGRRERSIDKAD